MICEIRHIFSCRTLVLDNAFRGFPENLGEHPFLLRKIFLFLVGAGPGWVKTRRPRLVTQRTTNGGKIPDNSGRPYEVSEVLERTRWDDRHLMRELQDNTFVRTYSSHVGSVHRTITVRAGCCRNVLTQGRILASKRVSAQGIPQEP